MTTSSTAGRGAPAFPAPRVVRTRAELRDALADRRAGRRAVVMTMGALHAGHLSLVHAARELADQVVVTIFVNPLQFGPTEDLDQYPRDLPRDLELLAGARVDVVFTPDAGEMYPDGEPEVRVHAGRTGELLEGALRPGHFDGMLTVVLKLLHLTEADVAVFGQKDAQQLMLIRRMVADLDLDVEVVGAPTVRDEDGVALSSRNAYLDPEQRVAARALSRALAAAGRAAAQGGGAMQVLGAASEVLAVEPGLVMDYVALVDPASAAEVGPAHHGPALLAVAGRSGPTRLIDNVLLDLRPRAQEGP
ncbi:pantoate--beta-alanine ligase [Actinotalea sp. K2]|uniref:pantoate--beta-alanine ligase n=1 Tax=Actinotalea sp. K2 TaxID=2939438 RepID=UPI002016F833|nr:pantoate--beta-alanine ligase [Actinotalea sp. K2]MCL3861458.1 pantoate--beta-alanine ligase [Actinotalea sp. K2]